MENLNSKRWFSIIFLYILLLYFLLKGTIWGFPTDSSSTIWSYISGPFTEFLKWVTGIFIVGESWKHVVANKK